MMSKDSTPCSSPPTSSSSSSSPSFAFVCVHCNTPCGSDPLYRYLTPNSTASIKLTLCRHCGLVADPYLEREYLLVAMDWILLRPPAYRHVLYNQLHFYLMIKEEKQDTNKENESSRLRLSNAVLRHSRVMILWGMALAILEAYLQCQGILVTTQQQQQRQDVIPATTNQSVKWGSLLQLSVADWLGRLLVWGTTYQFLITTTTTTSISTTNATSEHTPIHSNTLAIQLYMAWLLPTAMYGVAIMIIMWENTTTVTSLTTLLVWAMQFTALSSLLSGSSCSQPSSQLLSQRVVIAVFVLGLSVHLIWNWFVVPLAIVVPPAAQPTLHWHWSVLAVESWWNDW